jgi:putative membrane protein
MYLLFKALHIIGFTAWFAGLFYLPRLYIYYVENKNKAVRSQLVIMMRRLLYGITYPAMLFTLIFGIALIVSQPAWLQQQWIHLKLCLVIFLIGYHHYLVRIYKQLKKNRTKLTSFKLRLINEIATLFLIAIVTLAVLRQSINYLYWAGSLFILAVLFFLAVARLRSR